jgi:hypothetical protein
MFQVQSVNSVQVCLFKIIPYQVVCQQGDPQTFSINLIVLIRYVILICEKCAK